MFLKSTKITMKNILKSSATLFFYWHVCFDNIYSAAASHHIYTVGVAKASTLAEQNVNKCVLAITTTTYVHMLFLWND